MSFDFLANLLGVLTTLFAGLAWLGSREALKEAREREQLLNSPVSIYLENEEGGELVCLPYHPLRRVLSRAELLGVIGMFSGGRRFNIPGLTEAVKAGKLDDVLLAKSDSIVITTPPEEFKSITDMVRNLNMDI